MPDSAVTTPISGATAAIVPAAGLGQRFGDVGNKLFAKLDGFPLWYHSVARLRAQTEIGRIVLIVSEPDEPLFLNQYQALMSGLHVELAIGGDERTDSVRAGLHAIEGDELVRCVAIHDGARPLVSEEDLKAVIAAGWQTGAAILAAPVTGTIKRDSGGGVSRETVDRSELWTAMTPQVFHLGLLKEAYEKHNGRPATDDAELVERSGHPVSLVRGSTDNLKITYPEDLLVAEALLARQKSNHD